MVERNLFESRLSGRSQGGNYDSHCGPHGLGRNHRTRVKKKSTRSINRIYVESMHDHPKYTGQKHSTFVKGWFQSQPIEQPFHTCEYVCQVQTVSKGGAKEGLGILLFDIMQDATVGRWT